MKQLSALLVLVIVVVGAACAPIATSVEQPNSKSALFVGDSITTGITFPGAPADKPWWTHVAPLFSQSTVWAEQGWTSTKAVQSNPPGNYDVVFIALGANDFWLHPDETRRNLNKLSQLGTQCVIIAPWDRTGFAAATLDWRVSPNWAYVANAWNAANESGCGFVDWSSIRSDLWSHDGIHPNNQGSTILASRVLNGLIIK